MAWRDALRPASFRGAAFKVLTSGGASGRRVALHEYPQRDDPFPEDMGRSTRRFTLSGYIIGADYMVGRDALLKACETEGPGTLVHPYRGELQVSCEAVRWTESQDEGGKCAFELTFVEGVENQYPNAVTSTKAAVFDAGDVATQSSMDAFNKIYQFKGLQDTFIDTTTNGLKDFATTLAGLQQVSSAAESALVTQFEDVTRLIYTTADDIARSTGIPEKVTTALSLFRRINADALTAQRGLQTMRDFIVSSPAPIYLTDNRAVEARNAAGLTNLVRETAVVEQSRAVTTRELTSYDEAIAVRDGLVADLEGVLVAAGDRGDDGAYQSISTLQAAVTRDLTDRGASLAFIVYNAFARPLPALVLAHRLYQDVTREGDLIARNPTPHPGWMATNIEALSR